MSWLERGKSDTRRKRGKGGKKNAYVHGTAKKKEEMKGRKKSQRQKWEKKYSAIRGVRRKEKAVKLPEATTERERGEEEH